MELPRQDPDLLLRAIRSDASTKKNGKLKIFFGYAAGVGKTYAMLQAAHQAKERGIDVVAGYIEPHARPQTMALLDGLEQLPVKQIASEGMTLREFDIDAALKRNPQLILVDEFAHTNAESSRHTKRYQDVQELLNAGIDVYTTINVQHIESLNDTVASITGILVRERIPDSTFDQADQVELVDIEPAELLERLASGNVYREDQAQRATVNFFTLENLTALREIALRRCADGVNLLTERARIQSRGDYHTDEHILVCLSSSPSNPRIIRTAARMARAFRGTFTAFYVETPNTAAMSEEDKKRLQDNKRLAQQLGATIETSYGDDVPVQIAEFARLSGISKIVIGRSNIARKNIFSKPTLTERLISSVPNLDIHVIPDASTATSYQEKKRKAQLDAMPLRDVLKSIVVLLAATLIGCGFDALGFTESNIIAVYILGVLVTAVITTNRLCGILTSVVSVLVFNTKILFETNQLLQKEQDENAVITATAGQLMKLLKKDIVIYLSDGKELATPNVFRAVNSIQEDLTSENENAVADWVFRNNTHAGATTDTLSSAKCLYLVI